MTEHQEFASNFGGFAKHVAQAAAWLVLLIVIFVPLEQWFALHPAKIWRKQAGIDLAWYFVNSLLPAVALSFPLAMLASTLQHFNPWGMYTVVGSWPLWVKIPLALLVSDVGAYWYHRASHSVPFLWQFHAVHHSAEHIDWLVNTRAHPLDLVLTRLTGLVPVYLLGLAQVSHGLDPAVATVLVLGVTWTFFIHANIRVRLGPFEWLISSPAFHHWHHTNDEHRDRNFAAIFPFLDFVFGTAWLPKHWPPVYGIDAKFPPTLVGQFIDPLGKPPAD